MAVQTDAPVEIKDAVQYLTRISPPQEGKEVPWFTAIDEVGFKQLWEAVTRLEKMAHFKKTSKEVGGPHLLGGDAVAIKNPPPPPPPPLHHRHQPSPIHR